MTKSKVIEFGANKTLHIRISDKYWDVIFAMTQMSGTSPEEWCKGAIEAGIYMNLDARVLWQAAL